MKHPEFKSAFAFLCCLFVALVIISCEKEKQEKEEPVISQFTDPRDGNVYKTVKIGNQTWMAENLRYLPEVSGPDNISSTLPRFYVYGFNGSDTSEAKLHPNYAKFGVIYNWEAAQSACPEGWHLPLDIEWVELSYDSSGYEMKSKQGWHNNGNGSDTLQFCALPGGFLLYKDDYQNILTPRFSNIDTCSFWWAHYEHDFTVPYYIYLSWRSTEFDMGATEAYNRAFYIRCIKDE